MSSDLERQAQKAAIYESYSRLGQSKDAKELMDEIRALWAENAILRGKVEDLEAWEKYTMGNLEK